MTQSSETSGCCSTTPCTLWMVAGETSGDFRGAEFMQAMRQLDPQIRFLGAGGPLMARLAAEPFDNWVAEAGVLGLWDVLKRYPYFRRKFHRMRENIRTHKPDAVVLVDYPGFNLRLAAALRRDGYSGKLIYYVSPQVWAWNSRRIPKMAKLLDLMLCIFPFEKTLYEKSGLRTEFVGHPLVDRLAEDRLKCPRDETLVGFFPGSREREIRRIFPVMLDAARQIHASRPDIRFEVAAASEEHAARMREMASPYALPLEIHSGNAHSLMQRASSGIVCSGTATLEAAFFGLPYCLVYKIAWLTFEVGKRLVNIRHLGIINILAGRTVVQEYIQHFATPAALADEMLRLMNNPPARAELTAELAQITATLGGGGAAHRAALAALSALAENSKLSGQLR